MTKKKKTTMSVPEMQRLLGLGKTDAYWLVKKQCFETAIINGKIRIIIDSFEHWYARQVKHKRSMGRRPAKNSAQNPTPRKSLLKNWAYASVPYTIL